MAKTLADLLKNQYDRESIKGLFLRIGHHIIGERLIDRDLISEIESTHEKRAAEYIADILFNSPIVPEDEIDNNTNNSGLSIGKVCSKYTELNGNTDGEFRNIANYLITEQILKPSDLQAIRRAIKSRYNLNGEPIPDTKCIEYVRDRLYETPIMSNGSFKKFLKSKKSENKNGNGHYYLQRALQEANS